jgi:hypothetical protein
MSAITDLYDNAGLTYKGFIHVVDNLYISDSIYSSEFPEDDSYLPTREEAELIADNLARILEIRKMLGLQELNLQVSVWVKAYNDHHFSGTVDLRNKQFDMEPNYFQRLELITKRKFS